MERYILAINIIFIIDDINIYVGMRLKNIVDEGYYEVHNIFVEYFPLWVNELISHYLFA